MQVASRWVIIALIASLLLALSSLQVAALATAKSTTIRNQRQDNNSSINKSVHSKSEHSRRGFIASCTAAGALSIIAPSPSNAMMSRQHIRHNLANNDPPFHHHHHPSDTRSNSQPIQSTPTEQEKTVKQSTTLSAFQESISGFISGSAVSTVKTMVKYPLDTATVRLQMPNTQYTLQNLPMLFRGSFDGIVAPLLSNIPAGAVFFAVKDATKTALKEADLGLPKWALTTAAVAIALPPYWLIRNPSEVVKTRIQVRADGYYEGMSTIDAFKIALAKADDNSTASGFSELYQGYSENVIYGFPADVIKFVVYDYFSRGKGKASVSPGEGAVYGALSTGVAQLVTTPLDVLRNRIMAVSKGDNKADENLSYVERLVKIAKEEGVEELFAGSTPRVAKAMLSGAIQFATYEETKQKISQLFIKSK
jgi:hypothetical protein